MVNFIKAPSCIGCAHHRKWSNASNYSSVVTEFDTCFVVKSQGQSNGAFIEHILQHPHWFVKDKVDPADCSRKFTREIIKNSMLWVRLYFKGRERDWIVIEENKHEIFIEGNWFVRKVFGIADKFHEWQDKRREKRWLAAEAKRKAAVLTHIVKELPRA